MIFGFRRRLSLAPRIGPLLNDSERVDFSAIGDVAGAGRQNAIFAAASVFVDGELVGVRGGFDGLEGHFVAVGAASGVEDSACQNAELAIVGVDAEAEEVVLVRRTPSGT